MKNVIRILLCSSLMLIGCTPFYGTPKVVFKDEHIEVFEKQKVSLNPHASGLLYAVVLGRQYNHVKGAKPFYVWLEKGRRLLVVTRDDRDAKPASGMVWAITLDTGEVKAASLGRSDFGTMLNGSNPEWRDEVASVKGDELVLRSISGGKSREITVRVE